MTSSDLIYLTRSTLIHIQTLFHKFHLHTKFRPEGLSLAIIMGKVHVFIVFKLMMSSEFLYSRELSKSRNEFFKKLWWSMEGGLWGGPWKGSKGWSMEGVQGVVHGRGPRVVHGLGVQGVVHGLGVSVFNSPPK